MPLNLRIVFDDVEDSPYLHLLNKVVQLGLGTGCV